MKDLKIPLKFAIIISHVFKLMTLKLSFSVFLQNTVAATQTIFVLIFVRMIHYLVGLLNAALEKKLP